MNPTPSELTTTGAAATLSSRCLGSCRVKHRGFQKLREETEDTLHIPFGSKVHKIQAFNKPMPPTIMALSTPHQNTVCIDPKAHGKSLFHGRNPMTSNDSRVSRPVDNCTLALHGSASTMRHHHLAIKDRNTTRANCSTSAPLQIQR